MDDTSPSDQLSEWYLSQLFETNGHSHISTDLLSYIRSTLRRSEEVGAARDQWGNWEYSFAACFREGKLFTPWLDNCVIRSVRLPRRQLWPDAKRFALCITHDVDVVNSVEQLVCLLRKLKAISFAKRSQARAIDYLVLCASISKQLIGRKAISEFDFYDWLRLEDKHCFKSTFFFMSERKELPHIYDHFYDFDDIALYDGKPRSIRQIMDEINGNGWEIGLHGSYHSAIAPALLKEERECISNVIDSDVISGRQHWLHFDTEITPVRIAEAGLIIDSTHGFNRCIGFRSGTAFSYNLYDHAADKVLSVYEFPQHVMDGALFAANSLEYTEELATRHALELMTEIENVGGIFVLSFHPNYWHAEPAWRRVFENILSEAHIMGVFAEGGPFADIIETR